MDALPFIPGLYYNRRVDIHIPYGGSWQSGIAPSAKYPFIFIFTGKSGHQHGYRDEWNNANVFAYTGEGQLGDMVFSKGNLALRDHVRNGKRVLLFESLGKGLAKFVSELEIIDDDFLPTHDREGNMRNAIRFFFKKIGVSLSYDTQSLIVPVSNVTMDHIKTVEQRFVNTRVGQGAYRKSIIHRWEGKCAVTGFAKPEILIASHILPWAGAQDHERVDVHNGILLSPTYDALFDKSLISFENNGHIILSDAIDASAYQKIGVSGREQIKNFSSDNLFYLEQHRQKFLTL